jgi:hypothetical protein
MPTKKKDADLEVVRRFEKDFEVQYVPLTKLKHYPRNPNVGAVDEIEKSLIANGQYRPIIVQKSTMFILAGNHTFKALKELKAKEAACHIFDVDDEAAKRIVIADNRIPELSTRDELILAELLSELPDPEGTGFTSEEVESLIAAQQEAMDEVAGMMEGGGALADIHKGTSTMEGLNEDMSDEDEDDEEDEGSSFESVADTVNSVYQFGEFVRFPGTGYWQIPALRDDMLVEEIPDPLTTWAGSATRDHPLKDSTYWFYNFGTDSTSGMVDVSKIFLSFFSYDQYFECWWNNPTKYMTRAINSGIKYAVMPDFSPASFDEEPPVYSLHQLHKARWLARYFQEIGIRVMPNLQWPYNEIDFMEKYSLPGIPKNAPYLCVGLVAFNAKQDKKDLKKMEDCYRKAVDILQPQNLFVYTAKAGREWWETLNIGVPVHWQDARMDALSEQAKKREKKTTM